MITAIIKGRKLNSGEKTKKNGEVVPWTDLYLDDGNTVRVFGWSNPNVKTWQDDVILSVSIYNGENDFYIKFVSEVK